MTGVDLTALPLSPLEGFVLSRIDGTASVQVLADLTNLDEDHVHRMAERLIELGAAEWAAETVSLPLPTGRPSTKTPSREVEVPPFLRGPPTRPPENPARVRLRSGERPSVRPPTRLEGVYSSQPPSADEVDFQRSSVFPTSPRKVRTSAPPPDRAPLPELPLPPPPDLDDIPLPPPPSRERLSRLSESRRPIVEAIEEAIEEALPLPPPIPSPEELLPLPPSEPPPALEAEPVRPPSAPPVAPSESKPRIAPPVPPAPSSAGKARLAPPVPSPVPSSPPKDRIAPSVPPPPSAAAPSEPPASEPTKRPPSAPPAASAAATPEPVAETPAAEELDLDLERQRRIDDLYFALELLDHYQVLGMTREAPRAEIRNAYFQLSKVFHPDTMFRKRLGPYKARMEAIFQRLTEAYETLGKKKQREEYDRYLSLQDRTREVERTLDDQQEIEERERLGRQAAQFEADVAAGRPPSNAGTEIPSALLEPTPDSATSSEPPAPTSSTPPAGREMSEEGKRRQRELMAKKLRSASRASGSARRGSATPPPMPTAPKADRKEVLRGLASTLRQSSAQTGGIDPVQRHLAHARRAEASGDFTEAANHLRAALLNAPEREDLKREHARLSTHLARSMATTYEEQALYEERHGKWAAAALSWARVLDGRPGDAQAARRAAVALVEAGGDMRKAKELAQKAADLDPDNVENLRGLARVYIAAGLELNARRVLLHAAKLDPDDEMVENLLRDLGR